MEAFAEGGAAGRGRDPAAAAQFRDDEVDEGARGGGVGEVESVDVGLLDPALQFVGDRRRGAHHHGADAADAQVAGDLIGGPPAGRIGGGEDRERRVDRVGVDVLQGLLRREFGQVEAAPAAVKGEGPS